MKEIGLVVRVIESESFRIEDVYCDITPHPNPLIILKKMSVL
jgi:hypothetical protein